MEDGQMRMLKKKWWSKAVIKRDEEMEEDDGCSDVSDWHVVVFKLELIDPLK